MLTTDTKTKQFCPIAKSVISTEIEAIQALIPRIDHHFSDACETMLACTGRIIVLGMGKSGHIGRKIAATLASTGTTAFFVHPGEANHGDMGMITPNDVALILSNSGNTPELLNIVPLIKRLGVPLIVMTGQPNSALARSATITLDVSVQKEACSLGLAPTSSTTVTLVMGDALAIALLDARGFTSEDFAKMHPGGMLGRRLLLHVHDIMHTGDEMPIVKANSPVDEALVEITQKRLGMTAVVNDEGVLAGIFTDGDLRRTLDQGYDVHTTKITMVMTRNCITISSKLLAAEALQIMQKNKVTALLIVEDENRPIGVVHMHDLLRSGVF